MIRNMMLVALLVVIPMSLAQEEKKEGPKPQPLAAASQPAQSQPAAPNPRVKLETTLGDIVLELDAAKAPISVKNFLSYVDSGFFNGTIFHRVMSNFMIQGGGFTPDLAEKKQGLQPPIKNEWQNGLKNTRGTIAMARTPVADSATAQFFINVVDNGSLDMPRDGAAYAVFGKVLFGMDTVDKIKNTPVKEDPKLPMGKVVPVEPVVIKTAKRATVEELKPTAKPADVPASQAQAAPQPPLEDVMKKIEQETGKKIEKTPSGLMYVILKDGQGESPKPTDMVEVHYTGWLLDGKKFDSSVDRNKPFRFSLRGGVIKGWLEGVALMKVGEARKLIIPPDLAYGANPPPTSGIPANATLVFDVELLGIMPPK